MFSSFEGVLYYFLGFGLRDVENYISHSPGTVMRIASISKSIAMAAVAKLVEDGKLDLDKPVTDYVKSWPEKHPVITTRYVWNAPGGAA